MREIKFRAWDSELKHWIKPRSVGNCIDTAVAYQEIELMQYTGLKDKTGEEIYEGDVYKEGKRLRIVTFDNGCFMGDYNNGRSLRFIASADIEIIGNIHENPELLDSST